MKSLKYAFVLLYLCSFLTASATAATTPQVYTLQAIFIGVSESEGYATLGIRLIQNNSKENLFVAKDCRYVEMTSDGLQKPMTLDEFTERFAEHVIELDFVEYQDSYLAVECRSLTVLAF